MTAQIGWLISWTADGGGAVALAAGAEHAIPASAWRSADVAPEVGLEVEVLLGTGSVSSAQVHRRKGHVFEVARGVVYVDVDGSALPVRVNALLGTGLKPTIGAEIYIARWRPDRASAATEARHPAGPEPAPPQRRTGVIGSWNHERHFGVVHGPRGKTWLLVKSNIISGPRSPAVGSEVSFSEGPHPKRPGEMVAVRAVVRGESNAAAHEGSTRALSSEVIEGTVAWWAKEGHGIFRADDGRTVQGHRSQHKSGPTPKQGDRVVFQLAPHPYRPGAISARAFAVTRPGAAPRRRPTLLIGAESVRGQRHPFNEDGFLVVHLEQHDVWVLAVADGVSKPRGTGGWASDAVLDILHGLTVEAPELFTNPDGRDGAKVMVEIFAALQARYLERRDLALKKYRGAHSTLAVVVRAADRQLFAGVAGDTRIFLQESVDGQLRAPSNQPKTPGGAPLREAIGYPDLVPRAWTLRPPGPGRAVVIASDGVDLRRRGSKFGATRHLTSARSLQEAAERIVNENLTDGGDDATVIIFCEAGPVPGHAR